MTVYYVEDDENIRQLVLYALTQSGIQAEGQPDDAAFRAACAKSIPDVVVLDIMLPDVAWKSSSASAARPASFLACPL